jgi:hypothetical protein
MTNNNINIEKACFNGSFSLPFFQVFLSEAADRNVSCLFALEKIIQTNGHKKQLLAQPEREKCN